MRVQRLTPSPGKKFLISKAYYVISLDPERRKLAPPPVFKKNQYILSEKRFNTEKTIRKIQLDLETSKSGNSKSTNTGAGDNTGKKYCNKHAGKVHQHQSINHNL